MRKKILIWKFEYYLDGFFIEVNSRFDLCSCELLLEIIFKYFLCWYYFYKEFKNVILIYKVILVGLILFLDFYKCVW